MLRCISLTLIALWTVVPTLPAQTPVVLQFPAPEFRGIDAWINSDFLLLKEQKGKVVVLHFWTFGCINCIRNYPSYAAWHKDFPEKDLLIIGVHTPESEGEKNLDRIRQKVKDHQIRYPIAVDSALKTWKVWGNQIWPSVYLIDRHGVVRYGWPGELNWKGAAGEKMMRRCIEELIAEKGPTK